MAWSLWVTVTVTVSLRYMYSQLQQRKTQTEEGIKWLSSTLQALTMTVTLWMSLPSWLLSSFVSTLRPSRVSIQSQVECRAETQSLPLRVQILSLLALQPAQSPAQGVTALLAAPFGMLLLGKNINHILGENVSDPQRVTVRHTASRWSYTLEEKQKKGDRNSIFIMQCAVELVHLLQMGCVLTLLA